MPRAPGNPAARPASSSIWMGTNSSLTAAYLFHSARPVRRWKTGSSSPTLIARLNIKVPSVANYGAETGLCNFAALVGPNSADTREEHQSQRTGPLTIFRQSHHRRDHIARAYRHTIGNIDSAIQRVL